jgi:hypothetical protein
LRSFAFPRGVIASRLLFQWTNGGPRAIRASAPLAVKYVFFGETLPPTHASIAESETPALALLSGRFVPESRASASVWLLCSTSAALTVLAGAIRT